jgi:hypothetical protein
MEEDNNGNNNNNSDNENRNPDIQTRNLSLYKIILAPKPIVPPTRRETFEATRCRKAGMVWIEFL